MIKKIKKIKGPPKKLIGPITFGIVISLIIYTTIASAALNANLKITGEAVFIPYEGFAQEFPYTGNCEEYTVPKSGLYKLEVWGAEGGGSVYRGKGGYSTGKIQLSESTKLYICVGGQGKIGQSSITPGGFNGGGNALNVTDNNNGSGGGASDIRILKNSLNNRVIVAGGGGGSVAASGSASINNKYGHGGGLSGLEGSSNYNDGYISSGGTSIAGGIAWPEGSSGTFGQGGNGSNDYRTGGGGGWYGGASSYIIGGGGSGFVFSINSIIPEAYSLSSDLQLVDAYTIDGGSIMPSIDGQTTISGKSGNGHIKITYLGTNLLTGVVTYNTLNWTNTNVTATISTNATIINNGGLNTYQFNQNDEFIFQFNDGTKNGSAVARVTWIDKIAPDEFGITIKNTTVNSISLQGVTTDQGGSGIKGYQFSKDNGITWTTIQTSPVYQFTGLSLNVTYPLLIKAIDNAGNERISASKSIKLRTETFYATATTYGNISGHNWTNPASVYYSGNNYRYNITSTDIYGYAEATSARNDVNTSITYTFENIGTSNGWLNNQAYSMHANAKIISATIYTGIGFNRQTGTLTVNGRTYFNGEGLSFDTENISCGRSCHEVKHYNGALPESSLPIRGGKLTFIISGNTWRNTAALAKGRIVAAYLWGSFTAHWYDTI